MRKADYSHLASILARMQADARTAHVNAAWEDKETRDVAAARHQAARDVACDFARGASVNAAEFLKACGMT